MTRNTNLTSAKLRKNDEFYTLYSDIETELSQYTKHFEGKIVYCNCDNLYRSNFFRYFILHFNEWKLKKLICTCYANFDTDDIQLSFFEGFDTPFGSEKPYKIEITAVCDKLMLTSDIRQLLRHTNGKVKSLKGNGDFHSKECVKLLKQADIIVTNPPFSLFREYFSLLMQYRKQFLIVGSLNAVTYKEVFPYLKTNEVWLGNNQIKSFMQRNGEIRSFGNIVWFTNLDYCKLYENLILDKKYSPSVYQNYDNLYAIEVSKVSDIPVGYMGVMGVPISFMTKYNPKQFELIGLTSLGQTIHESLYIKKYVNAFQHNTDGTLASGSKINTSAVIRVRDKPAGTYYTADNAEGYLICKYVRVLIKRRMTKKEGKIDESSEIGSH